MRLRKEIINILDAIRRRDLANMLGVSRQTVHNHLNGDSMSGKMLELYASLLELKLWQVAECGDVENDIYIPLDSIAGQVAMEYAVLNSENYRIKLDVKEGIWKCYSGVKLVDTKESDVKWNKKIN